MAETVIPASPNWYCSKISDSNSTGVYVFAARHDVFCFDCQNFPPKFQGVFLAHKEKVTAVSVSQHEQHSGLCCSCSEDGAVKLWQLDTKEMLQEHAMHMCKVTAIAWSPVQDDLVVTADEQGTVGVWQFTDDRQSSFKPQKVSIFTLAASPSNSSIVAVGYKNGLILLIDVKRGGLIVTRLRGHDDEIHSLAWCPVPGEAYRGQQQSAGSQDITDLETFGVDDSWRKPQPSAPTGDGFGNEGWLIASGSRDRTIRMWSTTKSRQLHVFKLPNPGRRERIEEGGKTRSWITLYWPKDSPAELLSSSQCGDLLLWDITKTGKEGRPQPLQAGGRGHSRYIFNICPLGCSPDILCTVSMDRQILFWDLSNRILVGALPSLGGYVYCARTSPLDPGRLALGVGDGMIRIWNLNAPADVYDMTSLWQGIRGKVTSLSWHPTKDGVLAYGTDDGRVGVYDILSNRPPNISTTYHKRTVYVVSWGPACHTSDQGKGRHGYHVYSIGDGAILEHNPGALGEEAHSVNKLIQTTNPTYRHQNRVPTRSEICWNTDFTAVAVGNDDGTIEIYRPPNFQLLAMIQVHHKLINSIQWHPHVTMATPSGSPYKYWLASGSTESQVAIVDTTKIFDGSDHAEGPLQISECLRRLEGHCNRVTGVLWSPHIDGQLVSVSYDGNAIVWDVPRGAVIACYPGHLGKLLCVQWSGLDPDQVITGGDDFCVHRWKVSNFPVQDGQLSHGRSRKKKKVTKAKASEEPVAMEALESSLVSMTTEEKQDLEALLEAKRIELMDKGQLETHDEKEDIAVDVDAVETTGEKAAVEMTETGDAKPRAPDRPKTDGVAGDKKKRKAKSMFPVSGRLENRGKQFILQDMVTLAKLIYGPKKDKNGKPVSVELDEENAHLGLFLDRRAAYTYLNIEGQHHRNHDNMEYYYQLEIWKGNINGVLRVARQREELSDWLVAMAPMASYDMWSTVCEDYALQLESDGQYHKAASYFLACHKVYAAVKLLKRHKLFKEAIALAKVRLSPLDPALEELYTLWAQQLTKDGNYEQAAKCHLAMKQVQDAAKLLARRYDQSSLKAAAHISLMANDRQQGLVYTQRAVQTHLLQQEWAETYSYLREQKGSQVFLAMSSIHEMLSTELSRLGILTVDADKLTNWGQTMTTKKERILLPDFILDPEDADPMSPWQPHLVEGHTFPHHILRTWYGHFDIPIDTTSLEDMYKTLSLLHAGRQTQVDLQQVLIHICMDLTLCVLSLMMSETPTAMSHLLQAVGGLHETGRLDVLQGLLQLFLPQGPKYILKLQQEVTAMRVMISMDTHTHIDGASKVHTIKRYLSDFKDEGAVNNASLRCRELDCLRAYHYMIILNFLKERCNTGEVIVAAGVPEVDSGVGDSQAGKLDETGMGVVVEQTGSDTIGHSGNMEAGHVTFRLEYDGDEKSGVSETVICEDKAGGDDRQGQSEVQNETVSSTTDVNQSVLHTVEVQSNVAADNGLCSSADENNSELCPAQKEADDGDLNKDQTIPKHTFDELEKEKGSGERLKNDANQTTESVAQTISSVDKVTGEQKHSNDSMMMGNTAPTINLNHFSITISKLLQLSQGLLWDLQAKRYALTETLGYIHKAISQLLLSKKPKPSESSDLVALETSSIQSEQLSSYSSHTPLSEGNDENRMYNLSQNSSASPPSSTNPSIETQNAEGAVAMATSGANEKQGESGPHVPLSHCDHEHVHQGHLCHSLLSHHFDHMVHLHTEHLSEVAMATSENQDGGSEFNSNLFDICASCDMLHKSRKILWEDEPQFLHRTDTSLKDLTSIINPAKYINVPDEWYGMPMDEKYFRSYVTMAILKEEQEYVMHELKRGPDSTQSPFPNPLESVRSLVDVGRHSSHISTVERREFVQKVISWALNFAVTSQQKQSFVDLLQSELQG